jgi:exosortase
VLLLYGAGGNAEEIEHVGPSAFGWMIKEWNTPGGEYSHGWLIPLVSLAAVWRLRGVLVAAPKKAFGRGVAVVGLALILYWFGVKAQQTRLVLISFPMVVWGVALYVYGWAVARLLLFPCAYLLFCVPLVFIDVVAFPLRLLASSAAEVLLNGIGVPVQRAGTVITSQTGERFNIDVADPCSGLHSLMAMTALVVAYAYFAHRRSLARGLLVIGSLPIAVASNVIRVASIAMVATWLGEAQALAFYHELSGYVLFGAAVVLMIAMSALINLKSA